VDELSGRRTWFVTSLDESYAITRNNVNDPDGMPRHGTRHSIYDNAIEIVT